MNNKKRKLSTVPIMNSILNDNIDINKISYDTKTVMKNIEKESYTTYKKIIEDLLIGYIEQDPNKQNLLLTLQLKQQAIHRWQKGMNNIILQYIAVFGTNKELIKLFRITKSWYGLLKLYPSIWNNTLKISKAVYIDNHFRKYEIASYSTYFLINTINLTLCLGTINSKTFNNFLSFMKLFKCLHTVEVTLKSNIYIDSRDFTSCFRDLNAILQSNLKTDIYEEKNVKLIIGHDILISECLLLNILKNVSVLTNLKLEYRFLIIDSIIENSIDNLQNLTDLTITIYKEANNFKIYNTHILPALADRLKCLYIKFGIQKFNTFKTYCQQLTPLKQFTQLEYLNINAIYGDEFNYDDSFCFDITQYIPPTLKQLRIDSIPFPLFNKNDSIVYENVSKFVSITLEIDQIQYIPQYFPFLKVLCIRNETFDDPIYLEPLFTLKELDTLFLQNINIQTFDVKRLGWDDNVYENLSITNDREKIKQFLENCKNDITKNQELKNILVLDDSDDDV